MYEAGLTAVNLGLDTLDEFQYQIMTRRKGFSAVMKCIDQILEMNQAGAGIKLKINCVVMRGLNDQEVPSFVELGRNKNLEVRFIEYMPFGGNKWNRGKMVSFKEMLGLIRSVYPDIHEVKGHMSDTSRTFQIPGFMGRVGFITSMTDDFCATCNRLRITSDGNLKVCLHGNAEVSLRDIIRRGNDGKPMDEAAFESLIATEKQRLLDDRGGVGVQSDMGWLPRERELLQVIGTSVKNKKEKHASLDELAGMENRPMILIGG
ncbi:hypothetical protein K4F52_004916 [Lecanicillium sp. MT-2017a]|nr:hypothetical protein K4F52_004916 [Lecanicillium sp. MT-2017a]